MAEFGLATWLSGSETVRGFSCRRGRCARSSAGKRQTDEPPVGLPSSMSTVNCHADTESSFVHHQLTSRRHGATCCVSGRHDFGVGSFGLCPLTVRSDVFVTSEESLWECLVTKQKGTTKMKAGSQITFRWFPEVCRSSAGRSISEATHRSSPCGTSPSVTGATATSTPPSHVVVISVTCGQRTDGQVRWSSGEVSRGD